MRRRLVPALLLTSLAFGAAPAALAAPHTAPTAARTASAVSSTPILKAGAKGAAVLRVQKALGARQTGKFEAATVAAVKSFQRAHRISANGVVGASTWAAIARAEKAVAAAKADFAKKRATANAELAKQRSRIALATTFEVSMSGADQKVLLARLDAARKGLDAAAAAVAKAGTLAQVNAQKGWPAKATTAAYVVTIQARAVMVARADVWTAVMTSNLDRILGYSMDDGIVVDSAKEYAARQKVLAAGNAWRASVATAALTLFNTDPLSTVAKGRADAVGKSLDLFDRGVTGKTYFAAFDAYVALML